MGALKKFTDVDYVIAVSTVPTLEDIDTHTAAEATVEETPANEETPPQEVPGDETPPVVKRKIDCLYV